MKLFAVSGINYDDGSEIYWQLEHIFSTEAAAELYVASLVKFHREERGHFQIEEHVLHTGVEVSKRGNVNPV